jgi:hypothetical protein
MRIPMILATATLVLSVCNAIRKSISRRVGPPRCRCRPYFPDSNPYNSIGYAQNNTGIGH